MSFCIIDSELITKGLGDSLLSIPNLHFSTGKLSSQTQKSNCRGGGLNKGGGGGFV